MIIMAVDLGKARTGIAICDKLEMLSSPLTQISEYNRERLLEKISNLAKEKKAELIVVNLQKNLLKCPVLMLICRTKEVQQ